MITKKTRRHCGRYTPRMAGKMKFSEMIKEALEPQLNYDDWRDYRDGLRFDPDKTHIRSKNIKFLRDTVIKFNTKIKKLIERRRAKKGSVRNG